MRNDKIYRSWVGMRARCNNVNGHAYKYYGGRGIKVCKEWDIFENFRIDMEELMFQKIKITKGKVSLDRIDVNGDYCKENCRWANQSEQQRNTTRKSTKEIDGIVNRRCPYCLIFKPLNREYFPKNKSGYGYTCLICCSEYAKKRYRRKLQEELLK